MEVMPLEIERGIRVDTQISIRKATAIIMIMTRLKPLTLLSLSAARVAVCSCDFTSPSLMKDIMSVIV